MKEIYFEALFAPEILRRGKSYYLSGSVSDIRKNGDVYEAEVTGSETYPVAVRIIGGELDEAYCGCPYASNGRYCKHEAALLFAICELDESKRLF